METLISADNTWVLWGILVGVAAGAIWLEEKYAWASKLTGCVLALLGMMILANLKIVPTESAVYDSVWSCVVPLAIPLLLFQCNIKKIGKESGRLLILFVLSSIGTIVGTVGGYALLHNLIPDLEKVAAMFSGTYVGGSVNFASMADSFGASAELTSTAVVADNLLMAVYFFVLIAMPTMAFFRKHFSHPIIDQLEANGTAGEKTNYWEAKPIALKNIAFAFAAATIIVAVSTMIANLFASIFTGGGIFFILNQTLGNKYLIMTTLTMVCATAFPQVFGEAPGANEIGTFLIYIFFAVIGAPASIVKIITESPLLLVYALIVVGCNMIVTIIFGKLFKFNLEEVIMASNANIGGPTTAAAMAISKGWTALVGPVMLVGTLGYVLGNYYGIIIGNFLIP
ncbi:MAG: DUF819 family protein [Eubacteriales bacterium]